MGCWCGVWGVGVGMGDGPRSDWARAFEYSESLPACSGFSLHISARSPIKTAKPARTPAITATPATLLPHCVHVTLLLKYPGTHLRGLGSNVR